MSACGSNPGCIDRNIISTAIENSRRQARDEDPLESIKELRTLEEQRALDPESHDEAMDEDPYVRETGEILVDYMDLLRENQVARKG